MVKGSNKVKGQKKNVEMLEEKQEFSSVVMVWTCQKYKHLATHDSWRKEYTEVSC